jgi:hypothetical protein
MKTSTDGSRRPYRRCSEADKDSLADELKAMQRGGHLRPKSGRPDLAGTGDGAGAREVDDDLSENEPQP